MVRTFIAIDLDDKLRAAIGADIAALRAAAPRIKWSVPENLHLTLRFLGDVPENDLEELFTALREDIAGSGPFSLEICGLGAFPDWRHPRVVWTGIGEGANDALDLAAAVEAVCQDLGYDPENKPFKPHLTIGRVKFPADAQALPQVLAGLHEKEYGWLDVDCVKVYMSTLRRTGPVYSPMATIEL